MLQILALLLSYKREIVMKECFFYLFTLEYPLGKCDFGPSGTFVETFHSWQS